MGLQQEILKRTFVGTVKVQTGVDEQGNPVYEDKPFKAASAALIGGTPGQIYDVAYGPVVHTTTLMEAAEIGSFVKGQGIIINAPEYALYGTLRQNGQGGALAPSLVLPEGSVVSCMTAGHVWIQYKYLATVLENMNAAVIWQQEGATEPEDLLAVEVNGMKAYGPGDSTDNG